MIGRTIRPSATRRGQQVDNPPLTTSDTARVRMILQNQTADWHEALIEVEKVQAIHGDRWREFYRKEENPGFATGADIRNIWIALGAIGAIFGIVLTVILEKVFK